MNRIFADADVGRKNIALGVALFLVLGVVVGIPLTVDFMGGSLLSGAQYQTWKIIHGYGVFLAFVNFFFGFSIDRLNLTRRQKEISSWSFVIAGLFGGIGRSVLFLMPSLGEIGNIINLVETAGFVIGTYIFVYGQIRLRSTVQIEQPASAAARPG